MINLLYKAILLVVVGTSYIQPQPIWTFESVPGTTGYPSGQINDIQQDSSVTIWLTADYGFLPYDGYDIHSFRVKTEKSGSFTNIGILSFSRDVDIGNMGFVTGQGTLVHFNSQTNQLSTLGDFSGAANSPSATKASKNCKESLENVRVGGSNGITRYNPVLRKPYQAGYDSTRAPKVPSKKEHPVGVVWVGVSGSMGEAYQFIPNEDTIAMRGARYDTEIKNSLSSKIINEIRFDAGDKLWIAMDSGLNLWDLETERVRHFYKSDIYGNGWIGRLDSKIRGVTLLGRTLEQNGFPRDAEASNIKIDGQDNPWLGTKEHGLSMSSNWPDWILTSMTEPADNGLTAFQSAGTINVIYKDRSGTIWIGTADADLWFVTKGSSEPKRIPHNSSSYGSLAGEPITPLFEGANRNLRVGTLRSGLYRLNPDRDSLQRFTSGDGLADNSISSIIEDGRGQMWPATGHGLSTIRSAPDSFHTHVPEMSMPDFERFLPGAAVRMPDDDLIFPPIGEALVVNPSWGAENDTPPRIIFKRFMIRSPNKKMVSIPLPNGDNTAGPEIQLKFAPPLVLINYAALDFVDPEQTRYAYRLLGYDDSWNYVKNKKYAAFMNLKPGTYTFQVKGANPSGVWNTASAELRIIIPRPWWGSSWAVLSYLVIFTVGVVIFDRIQRKRIRAKVRAKVEQEYLQRQLEMASLIQQKIIPDQLPPIEGCEIAGFYIPSKNIGGDYYECFQLPNNRYAMIIADVSGKGISAAMLVNSLHAAVHSYLENNNISITQFVERLNDIVVDTCTIGMFITFFAIFINTKTFEFESVNAGHPPMLHFDDDLIVRKLHKGGIPLGLTKNLEFDSDRGILLPGQSILLFTDGISEAMNAQDELYGESDQFTRIVEQVSQREIAQFKKLMLQDIEQFTRSKILNDDVAVLYIRR